MSYYITCHTDPDYKVVYEQHEKFSDAQEYAREVANEEGGEVAIYFHMQTIWPKEETKGEYRVVRAGVDYPATL